MPRKKKEKETAIITVKWKSTMIQSTDYNPQKEMLTVNFVSGGSYNYFYISNCVYLEFAAAESQGKYFISDIRGNHDYEKLKEKENEKSRRS